MIESDGYVAIAVSEHFFAVGLRRGAFHQRDAILEKLHCGVWMVAQVIFEGTDVEQYLRQITFRSFVIVMGFHRCCVVSGN